MIDSPSLDTEGGGRLDLCDRLTLVQHRCTVRHASHVSRSDNNPVPPRKVRVRPSPASESVHLPDDLDRARTARPERPLVRHAMVFARYPIVNTLTYIRHIREQLRSPQTLLCPGRGKVSQRCTQYRRAKLLGVKCPSVFGCCAFPGYPQETTSYLGAPAGVKPRSTRAKADGTIQMKAAISAAMPYF